MPPSDTVFVNQNAQKIAEGDVNTQIVAGDTIYAGIPYNFKYEFTRFLYKSKDETLIGLRIPLTNPVDIPKPIITSMNLIRENVDSRLPLAIQVVRKAINAPDRNPDAATNKPNSRGRCSGS